MNSLSGPGIVLRRHKRGEEDIRLTLFFRDAGKLLATSKGGQKPASKLKALQEPFTEADFHVFAPEHGVNGRLAGGRLMDSHQGLRGRYEAFETASRACETVDVLVPFRAPSGDVYDILRTVLRSLAAGSPPTVEWVLFVTRLLMCLGHGDVSDRLLALLEPSERAAAGAAFESRADDAQLSVQPQSLERCLNLVNAELEHILPWKLKSDRARADADEADGTPVEGT
ncbi:MAG: DNA repair protein RecO [Elusimicrobia bacterium]|nr:DNA repair protein RecO [Elusimicrobiota bacterium]